MATPAIRQRTRLERGSAEDLDAVMHVMEAAFGTTFGEAWTRSQCAGILPMAGVRLTVAVDEASGRMIGFSLSREVADDAELLLIAVRPDRHRQGVGRELLDAFMAGARERGASRVHLEVRDGNPAVGMYRAAGFEAVGRRYRYYMGADGNRHDAVTLACQV